MQNISPKPLSQPIPVTIPRPSQLKCVSLFLAIVFWAQIEGYFQENDPPEPRITVERFIDERSKDPYGGKTLRFEHAFSKIASKSDIKKLLKSRNDWLAVTAQWWSTRNLIDRDKNQLSAHEREIAMSHFIGYVEGRLKQAMPKRMKRLLSSAVAEKQYPHGFPDIKPECKDVLVLYDRDSRLKFFAETNTTMNPTAIYCMDTKSKVQKWKSKLTGLNDYAGIAMSFSGSKPDPPKPIWASIEFSNDRKSLYYWGVHGDGSFVLRFDAATGNQLGAARFSW